MDGNMSDRMCSEKAHSVMSGISYGRHMHSRPSLIRRQFLLKLVPLHQCSKATRGPAAMILPLHIVQQPMMQIRAQYLWDCTWQSCICS